MIKLPPYYLVNASKPKIQRFESILRRKETGIYGEFFNDIYSGIRRHLGTGRYYPYVSERGILFRAGSLNEEVDALQVLKRLRRYHGMLSPGEANFSYTDDKPLTARVLREKFRYSPVSGLFRRMTKFATHEVGDEAGYVYHKDSHLSMRVLGQTYPLHKLAWLYQHGEFPHFLLHHKNKDDLQDNSMVNLVAMVARDTHNIKKGEK